MPGNLPRPAIADPVDARPKTLHQMMTKNGTSQMADQVLAQDFEVVPLLVQLGLDKAGLIEAVRYAESERSLCTPNDAAGFAAMTVYDKAARRLREIYCGARWERDESNNQAGIRNPALGVRVVPCNFDQNTGNPLIDPLNRSPKGEVSRAKTRCNATGWLPGLPDVPAQEHDNLKTWVLGIYAAERRPLRAELSFPVDFDLGYFTRFSKRIILLNGTEHGDPFRDRIDLDNDDAVGIVDISISRK